MQQHLAFLPTAVTLLYTAYTSNTGTRVNMAKPLLS